MKTDDENAAEIEVNVEKEIDADGNEIIKNKNIWRNQKNDNCNY